mmetsp:Transcript_2655/g.6361  ORF Transcript_2655/g.6361 Transcript_2655/m.6361 type:complete len:367 (+) Transcript_2655:2971-4071(+)
MSLDVDTSFHLLLALLLDFLEQVLHNLIRHMSDVRSSTDRTNRIDEADLAEAPLCQTQAHLPSLAAMLVDDWYTYPRQQVQVSVVPEAVDVKLLAVQVDRALLGGGACNVVDSLHHQGDDVVVHRLHPELRQIGLEGDFRVGALLGIDDFGSSLLGHVVLESLGKVLGAVSRLDRELCGEDIGKLRPVAVAATHNLAVGVVVVVTGEQMTKNHLGNVDFVLLVDDHRETSAIVPHGDGVVLLVDVDFDGVHALRVADQVVGSIHDNLIEDLVQCRSVGDLFVHHPALHGVKDPKFLLLSLGGANICVWPQQDVLQLGLLLVNLLDCLASPQSRDWLCPISLPGIVLLVAPPHIESDRCAVFKRTLQ